MSLPAHVLEQQRRPPGLHHPVRDLRDFEVRVHLHPNPPQLVPLLQQVQKLAQVLERHGQLRLGRQQVVVRKLIEIIDNQVRP